jgi:hypothetical protein
MMGASVSWRAVQSDGVNFDLSRSDVENLLAGFLAGAIGLELRARLDISQLPVDCRKHMQQAKTSGRAWTAWATERGPIAAWGDYHFEASKGNYAHLLLIEWSDVPTGHHSLWCYCDPKRPTEWTVGEGRA